MSNGAIADRVLNSPTAVGAICFTLLGVLYFSHESTKESRNFFASEQDKLTRRVETLERLLADERHKGFEWTQKISLLEDENRTFKMRVQHLESENAEQRASIRHLEQRNADLEQQIRSVPVMGSMNGGGGILRAIMATSNDDGQDVKRRFMEFLRTTGANEATETDMPLNRNSSPIVVKNG